MSYQQEIAEGYFLLARPVAVIKFFFIEFSDTQGYWHQRADERHGNPPQGNQELLVVTDNVRRTPGDLGVSKSMECDIFPFRDFTLLEGDRKGVRLVKKTGCWFVGGDHLTGALHDLQLQLAVVTTTSVILCFNKHRLTEVHLENGR